MTVTTTPRRPTVAARRAGYGVAITINAVLLYAINVSPGWDVVPFLTADTTHVLGWVNASIVAGIIANSLYLLVDRRWFKASGEIVVTLVGLTALIRLWQVFPFSFDDEGIPWHEVARWVLGIGVVGSIIAFVVNVVALGRASAAPRAE
jgi:drug/metabolite transporter (DMT)-like permease